MKTNNWFKERAEQLFHKYSSMVPVIGSIEEYCNKEQFLKAIPEIEEAAYHIAHRDILKQNAIYKSNDQVSELYEAVKVELQIIKNLIASKRVVNLDEAISYYESLLKKHENHV